MLGVGAGKLLVLGFVVPAFLSSLFLMLPRGRMIPRVTSIESGSGIYRLEQLGGRVRYKNLNEYSIQLSKAQTATQIDSTVFDLRTMSDSVYANKYTFWQEVAVSGGQVRPMIAGDINKNGRAELYGYEKLYSTPQFGVQGKIYELDTSETFRLMYTYPDSVTLPLARYDIDRDGTEEIVQHILSQESEVYRCSIAGSLPTLPSFGFNPFVGIAQMDRPTFGDFDNDGKTDVVYFITPSINRTFIAEYNPASNSMDTVYSFNQPDIHAEGFSVGDFDQNGKTDIVEGSIHGYVFVIEAQGVGQYAPVWTGQVETYNAYLHMKTNDIDGNGKPEFWVGGDAYYNGLGITRFTCFESDGVHSYKPVHRIDLIGVFSFFAGNCFAKDIDGDGKEELFICIDQHVMILKFIGSPNNHRYEMYYLKINELADQNSVYLGATLYDLTGSGKDKLLITMDQVNANQERREFTRIYKRTSVDDVQQHSGEIPASFQLFQNYPNPFNASTTIKYELPRASLVTLTVYDVLAREVATLVNEAQEPGYKSVQWDASGVSSSVYFYRLSAGDFVQTKKLLLLH